MVEKFSAEFYMKMSPEKFNAEAEKLKVDLYGKSRNQQIDAVYNAELRRRQEEQTERGETVEPATNVEPTDTLSTYDSFTVAELREMADERGIEIDAHARKADIIAALEADDESDEG